MLNDPPKIVHCSTEWIAKTTWSRYDFDEDTEKILEEAIKYV